jgi:RNA polymerase sigma-70 factor (sigma-E family)
MKLARQCCPHRKRSESTPHNGCDAEHHAEGSTDGGAKMNALHSTTSTAVHSVPARTAGGRSAEVAGTAGARGYGRGNGRTLGAGAHLVPRQRPAYITPVDAAPAVTDSTLPADGADLTATSEQAEAKRLEAEAAFTAYVKERRSSLYATAYHRTGDRFAAEDLLQSALFSTYRAWDRITDKAAVGGYMRRTMTNLHISAWRRRKVNEYPTEEMPETVGDTDAMGGTELRAVLWQALARLPENQRTMLVLRYYEGRTDPEIADVLNISVGTVKSSIWRALRRLREDEILASRDGDLGGAFGELVA